MFIFFGFYEKIASAQIAEKCLIVIGWRMVRLILQICVEISKAASASRHRNLADNRPFANADGGVLTASFLATDYLSGAIFRH